MDDRLLLRPSDVMKALALGRSTVYEMLRTGSLPSISITKRSRRVSVSALEKWINERTAVAADDGTSLGGDDDSRGLAPRRVGLPGPPRRPGVL